MIPCKECVSIVKPMCCKDYIIICNDLFNWVDKIQAVDEIHRRKLEAAQYHGLKVQVLINNEKNSRCYYWRHPLIG